MIRKQGKVIGIDLGTTNSAVAFIEGDRPVIIPNSEGGRVTPSVVAISPKGELLVGQLARRQAILHPDRTVANIKRHMGTDQTFKIDNQVYTPTQIASMILVKLRRDAETYLGTSVDQAVITVPAYFNDSQRQATKEAGEMAGLEVIRIVNEPTAAALAYGINKSKRETILVWDLGGGTFDVSLLVAGDGIFEVRATSGDTSLGGNDYDHALVEFLAERFQQAEGIDLHSNKQAMQRLMDAAERAKIELSTMASTSISLPFLYADAHGPRHLELDISRTQFESLTTSLTRKLRAPFDAALKDAKIRAEDLNQVILVGGATRMPAITQLVRLLTGHQPHQGVNPDEVVAMGAAIQAGMLVGTIPSMLLLDVTPLSLGVEVADGQVYRLVERNTPLPIRHMEEFTTSYDNQSDVEVHVVQGESSYAAKNFSLGRFRLDGIPPAPHGTPRITVAFDIDVNGIVTVSATDMATGHSRNMSLDARNKPPDPGDISSMGTGVLGDSPRYGINRRSTRNHNTRSRNTGTQQAIAYDAPTVTIDSTAISSPQGVDAIRRADAIMGNAQWILSHSNPPLTQLERLAIETALDRIYLIRQRFPLNETRLHTACDELERLQAGIVQQFEQTDSR
jgi:molecular chaperone DnaK